MVLRRLKFLVHFTELKILFTMPIFEEPKFTFLNEKSYSSIYKTTQTLSSSRLEKNSPEKETGRLIESLDCHGHLDRMFKNTLEIKQLVKKDLKFCQTYRLTP